MQRFIIALCLLLAGSLAHATTYYFSDCQAGADPACVAGSDTNDGLSPASPFKTLNKGLPAGVHTRRYAKGGAWVFNGLYTPTNKASTAANPSVWESYTPSWGPGTARPIWTFTYPTNPASNNVGVYLAEGSCCTHDEGYVFRGIELRGPAYVVDGRTVAGPLLTGRSGFGFDIRDDMDYVTLDDLWISGFVIGVNLSGDLSVGQSTLTNGANHKNEHITLTNSDIFNNYQQGWLGGGWDVLVENNKFENNGFGDPTYDHNIYIGTANWTSGTNPWSGANMTFRGNYLTKSNYNPTSHICQATSLVGHFNAYNVIIENNTVYEPQASGGCYGIQLTALNHNNGRRNNHASTIVRGNRVVMGGGGVGISATSCLNCLIENNVIVRTGVADPSTANYSFVAIILPEFDVANAINGLDGFGVVRNNSIYIDYNYQSTGIDMRSKVSSGETVVNNMIVFGPTSTPTSRCFETNYAGANRTAASFTAFDYNLCYRAGGDPVWNPLQTTLTVAQAAGFDAHSLKTDPLLVAAPSLANNWSMAVQTGSPAINAGHPTLSSKRAIDAKVPVGARDIGAFDFGATVVAPPGPTMFEVN